ncbi:hypothetical protein V1517DRAFT_354897 [Lipomyces orientalis]|uniref:Uncharacterized protein n=1 Tax=Lipomyces orientalis TaxID=1233043 RepID=A0ACC3TFT5_9ASCO
MTSGRSNLSPTPSEGGSTAGRKQMSLKKLACHEFSVDELIQRDGWISLVGKMMDENAPPEVSPVRGGYGGVTPQAAHIVPFNMEGLLLGENINDPSNALLLDALTHTAFSLFKFKNLAPDRRLPSEVLRHCEDEEIIFGQASRSVARLSPLLCSLHHAIARVLWASGAAESIAMALSDEDELKDGNMEGDYWHRVRASYRQRELRALPGLDELAIDRQDDNEDLYIEEANLASSFYNKKSGRVI